MNYYWIQVRYDYPRGIPHAVDWVLAWGRNLNAARRQALVCRAYQVTFPGGWMPAKRAPGKRHPFAMPKMHAPK